MSTEDRFKGYWNNQYKHKNTEPGFAWSRFWSAACHRSTPWRLCREAQVWNRNIDSLWFPKVWLLKILTPCYIKPNLNTLFQSNVLNALRLWRAIRTTLNRQVLNLGLKSFGLFTWCPKNPKNKYYKRPFSESLRHFRGQGLHRRHVDDLEQVLLDDVTLHVLADRLKDAQHGHVRFTWSWSIINYPFAENLSRVAT